MVGRASCVPHFHPILRLTRHLLFSFFLQLPSPLYPVSAPSVRFLHAYKSTFIRETTVVCPTTWAQSFRSSVSSTCSSTSTTRIRSLRAPLPPHVMLVNLAQER